MVERESAGAEGEPPFFLRGGGEQRVAKYRSSSLVRNKEQKIDRLLSFMFPGAGEGGLPPPPFSVDFSSRSIVRPRLRRPARLVSFHPPRDAQ